GLAVRPAAARPPVATQGTVGRCRWSAEVPIARRTLLAPSPRFRVHAACRGRAAYRGAAGAGRAPAAAGAGRAGGGTGPGAFAAALRAARSGIAAPPGSRRAVE